VHDMPELAAAAAAAAPPRWNSDLKTPSKIYEFAGIPKNLNWVISSRFWIIPKKNKFKFIKINSNWWEATVN